MRTTILIACVAAAGCHRTTAPTTPGSEWAYRPGDICRATGIPYETDDGRPAILFPASLPALKRLAVYRDAGDREGIAQLIRSRRVFVYPAESVRVRVLQNDDRAGCVVVRILDSGDGVAAGREVIVAESALTPD